MNEYEIFNGRVFVPSNLKKNKKTIIGKLDIRDIIFILVGGSIFALIFFSLKNFLENQTVFMIAMVFSVPIIILGFIRIDGLKIEEYVMLVRTQKAIATQVRINNSDNIYEILEKLEPIKTKKKNIKF